MVRRSLHRGGLGLRLTEALLEWARSSPDVRVVALNTSQLTTGFYERVGFHVVEVVPEGRKACN